MYLCMTSFSFLQFGTVQAVQLGADQDDKTTSELFASVGKVYIGTFQIGAGMNTTLDIKIEDIQGSSMFCISLRGYGTPDQFCDCLCIFLKICNTLHK